MAISERSQIIIIWVSLAFGAIWLVCMGTLLHMLPPPDADWPATQVAAWYVEHGASIRLGATISSWTSGFLVPFWAVVAMQISRQETGRPIWSTLAALGGATMSIFIVAPALFWGVAAFNPGRPADSTALMHELGTLTFMTTCQYFVIGYAALTVTCFLPQRAKHSPFPRWFGYFNIWAIVMFELGAIAFNYKTGPFSWNGLFVFWSPITLFAITVVVLAYLLLTKLQLQRREALNASAEGFAAQGAGLPTLG